MMNGRNLREVCGVERLIFHVDVNSAFLSWEAVRRVKRGEADLRLIPSVISGDPDRRTSIVLAKSIPAKAFGIRTGEPVSMALRKCPDLVLAPPDFRLYEEGSEAFMSLCRRYAPVVEKFSIDECFLDMSGTAHSYPDPMALAHRLKDEIRDSLGFTVNIGAGSNKLLAKMAGDFEKPDKVHSLFSHELKQKLWPLPVEQLLFVGGSTAAKLARLQIRTVGDLARADRRSLELAVGVKLGEQLHRYAWGLDDSPVLAQPPQPKGYSVSTTLEEDVTDLGEARRILLALADSAAGRMRTDGARAGCISVTARASDFRTRSHQQKLPEATDITNEIYSLAAALFAELWDGRTPLRLLGLSLTDIRWGDQEQYSLFQDEKKDRARKLDRAMDAIRDKYGADTILRGSLLDSSDRIGRKFKARQQLRRENE